MSRHLPPPEPGKEPDPVYVAGDLSPENLMLLEDETAPTPLEIYNRASNELEDWLVDWGAENGFDSRQMRGLLENNEELLSRLTNEWIAEAQGVSSAVTYSDRFEDFFPGYEGVNVFTTPGTEEWMAGNPDGQINTVEKLWGELEKIYPILGPSPGGRTTKTTGPRRATASEIRNRYDTTQLAGSVNDIWRLLLLESNPRAKQMATEYVEAIVATRGEKAIDFETFVREKAKKTTRYKSIYRKKPDSHSEEQFLQPYFQAAQQRLRPQNAAGVAIGGAQFGADASAFNERLNRSNENVTSAPFIQQLGARVESLKGLLKG